MAKSINCPREKNKFKRIGEIVGSYRILDIIDNGTGKMMDATALLECKNCKVQVYRPYKSLSQMRFQAKKYTESGIFYEGCKVCNKNEMVTKLSTFQVGTKLYDGRIITKIEKRPSGFLRDAKVTIYCEKCRKNSNIIYNSLAILNNTKTVCKSCRKKEILPKTITKYKNLVGTQIHVLKIIGGWSFNRQIDLSKVKCQCTKCGNISIKRVGNLKSFKRQPIRGCSECPQRSNVGHMFPRNHDLSGLRFGIFKVLEFSHVSEKKCKERFWKIQCNCGNIQLKSTGALTRNLRKTIPAKYCSKCYTQFNTKYKVGMVLVNGFKITDMNINNKTFECECGNCKSKSIYKFHTLLAKLKVKNSTCKQCHKLTHGESKTRFWKIWNITIAMFRRKNVLFDDRWEDYTQFKEDMLDSYIEGYELVSDNGIWNKQNCKWVQKIKNKEEK